jgi:hypothetical protein
MSGEETSRLDEPARARPGVAIIGLSPGPDGSIVWLRSILRRSRDRGVLALSLHDELFSRGAALETGGAAVDIRRAFVTGSLLTIERLCDLTRPALSPHRS